MGRCQLCGKEEMMLFTCKYCRQHFCSEHRLPENHLCPNMPNRGWNYYRRDVDLKYEIEKQRIRKRDSKEYSRRTKRKTNTVLIIFLVIIGVIGIFYLYDPTNFMSNILSLPKQISTQLNKTTHQINTITDDITKPANEYKNYYFGLIKTSEGVIVNSYGDFVVLINNRNAIDPTYSQLIKFLETDKTDEFLYVVTFVPLESYQGSAESYVDIDSLKEIIDGTKQLNTPRICVDFAEMLHNKAEIEGFRCAFIHIELDNNIGHGLVAFNTSDRGLIYIDDTGAAVLPKPSNCDKIIDALEIGLSYVPRSLFPEPGWETTWENVGVVTDIYMTWDGNWDK